MALLPDLRFRPYAQSYVGSANKEFEGVLRQKISDYDVAKAQDDILGLQTDTLLESVAPFEKDREHALKVQDIFRKRIEDRVNTGNYEDMVASTTRDAREFMKRIAPLQENYKRYSDYIQTIDKQVQEGDIDRETGEATKKYALSVYKGIDPNNVSSTLFRGIQPGKKFNITEFIDKIGNDWESNKGAIEVELPNGRIIKKSWDQLTPQELSKGFERALKGNRDFQSYAETQGMIGLGNKAGQEITDAINYGLQKYSKNNIEQGIDFVPEWVKNDNANLDAYRNIGSVPNSPIMNPNAKDLLEGMSFDKATGTAGINQNEYLVQDGDSIYKYTDSNGNLLTKKQVRDRQTESSLIQGRQSKRKGEFTKQELDKLKQNEFKKVPASKQEIDSLNIRNNAIFDQIIKDAQQVNGVKFTTPEAKERVFNSYKKAIENLQTVMQNKRLDLGVESRFRGNGLDQRMAQDLSGRKIYVKSSDPSVAGIIKTDQGVDFNALRAQLYDSDDQWEIVSTTGGGFDIVNPYGSTPSADIKIEVKNKDGKTATIKVGAEMTPTEGQALQPLQDVMTLYSKGTSGSVKLPNGMSFKVNTGVDLKTERMLGQVQVVDENGVTLDTVSIDTFDNYYINLLKAQDNQLRAAGHPSILEQVFGSVKKFGSKAYDN